MKKIVSTYGPKRTKRTQTIALLVAALVVIMLVAQLFGYEDFASILGGLMPYSDKALLALTAAVIVIAELLALPYLLGMYLSPLMRLVSAYLATGISLLWMFTCFTNSHASNSGIFSSTFDLPGGILATAWSLVLFVGVVMVIRADTQSIATPLEKKH